jgi:hypothetical protein
VRLRVGWAKPWPEFEGFIEDLSLPIEEVFQRHISAVQLGRCEAMAEMDRNRTMGEAKQRTLLSFDEQLVHAWRSHLPAGVPVAVDLELLSIAWSSGLLRGRRFDVLANRYPLRLLHESLDHAARMQPGVGRHLFFRSDASSIECEDEALLEADRVVCPNACIGEFLLNDRSRSARVHPVEWVMPRPARGHRREKRARRRILYPDHGIARRGAPEVAVALAGQADSIELVTYEGTADVEDQWGAVARVSIRAEDVEEHIARDIDLVVLPAFMEYRPNALLIALANDVAVIASPQCGITKREGLQLIEPGDSRRLKGLIQEVLTC